MSARIRKGDTVVVISGKDKGKKGKVTRVLVEDDRVSSRGSTSSSATASDAAQPAGGIVEREQPIHASKVMPVDPKTGGPTRVRFKVLENGKKVRVAVKSGEEIPAVVGVLSHGRREEAKGRKGREAQGRERRRRAREGPQGRQGREGSGGKGGGKRGKGGDSGGAAVEVVTSRR